jgi:hypothetical protein
MRKQNTKAAPASKGATKKAKRAAKRAEVPATEIFDLTDVTVVMRLPSDTIKQLTKYGRSLSHELQRLAIRHARARSQKRVLVPVLEEDFEDMALAMRLSGASLEMVMDASCRNQEITGSNRDSFVEFLKWTVDPTNEYYPSDAYPPEVLDEVRKRLPHLEEKLDLYDTRGAADTLK